MKKKFFYVEEILINPHSFAAQLFLEDGDSLMFHTVHANDPELSRASGDVYETVKIHKCLNAEEVWEIMRKSYEANSVTRQHWDRFLKEYV